MGFDLTQDRAGRRLLEMSIQSLRKTAHSRKGSHEPARKFLFDEAQN